MTQTRTTQATRFEELEYVFGRVDTGLMTVERERTASQELWQRRRRILLLTLKIENPEVFRGPMTHPAVHQEPLSGGLVRRVIAAEKRARAFADVDQDLAAELEAVEALRNEMFHRNLRLVAWVARSYVGKGLDLVDLFQEGSMALMSAVDRFDPARGVRLSTFATHAIRLSLVRALADRGRMIRVPNYRLREMIDTSKARTKFLNSRGNEPASEELAKEAKLSKDVVDELLPAIRPLRSLDAMVGDGELHSRQVVADGSSPSPFEFARRNEQRQRADDAIDRLPERERRIIALRYGLADGEEHSYEEIGKALGLSRERTRQLEKQARGRLKVLLKHQAG